MSYLDKAVQEVYSKRPAIGEQASATSLPSAPRLIFTTAWPTTADDMNTRPVGLGELLNRAFIDWGMIMAPARGNGLNFDGIAPTSAPVSHEVAHHRTVREESDKAEDGAIFQAARTHASRS